MASAAPDGDRGVSIGRVLRRGFGTIGRNPAATLGIAFLFSALPSVPFAYAAQIQQLDSVAALGLWAQLAVLTFPLLFVFLLSVITQAALVRMTVAFCEGDEASFGESVVAALRVALPLFLLAVVSTAAMLLGLLLLVVPAVILYLMWSVAAPALVEERLGPIEALGRSRNLTKGARWKILGLTLAIVLVYALGAALVEIVSDLLYGSEASGGDLLIAGPRVGELVADAVGTTIAAAISGVMQPALYVELRDWKDGPRTDTLADIFG